MIRTVKIRQVKALLMHLCMLLAAGVMLSPLVILLSSSLRTPKNMVSPLNLFVELSLESYKTAFSRMNYLQSFFNSVIITVLSVLAVVVLAGMASYPMARIKSRTAQFLYLFFLAGLVIPSQMVIVPIVQMLRDIHIPSGQLTPVLLFITCSLPFSTFLYTGFIRSSVPEELEEATYLDGAGLLIRYWKIVFPLIKPATVSVVITQGVWIWNDFFLNMIFVSKSSEQPLPLAMLGFMGDKQNPAQWNILFAACVLCALPLIGAFTLLQRQFIGGLTVGAVKG